MKKVSVFMIAACVAVGVAFVSCGEIEEIIKPSNAPSIQISFTGYSGSTGNVTLPEDKNEVEVVALIKAPGKINEISIKKSGGANITGYPKSGGFDSETEHTAKWTVKREKTDGSREVISFDVTVTDMDKEPHTKSATVEITFEQVIPATEKGNDINVWSNKLLGSLEHSGTAGSSFASIDGSVYLIADARTNSAKVDFIYYNFSGTSHTISSPNSTYHSSMDVGWTTKNKTKLQRLTTITVAEFDAMVKDALIVEKVTSTTSESVANLAAGNIIGFITDGGKKGLIKVNSVNSPANHINITVKVQK